MAEGQVLQNLSKAAAQAGIAIDIARRLESALGALGATGKGLHEKTSSVSAKLPAALVEKLRFIASVRNKIAHEDALLPDEDFSAFEQSGRQAIEELAAASAGAKPGAKAKPRKKAKPGPRPAAARDEMPASAGILVRQGVLAFFAGIVLVFLLMILGGEGPGLWGGAFAIYFLLGSLVLRKSRRAAGTG